MDIAEPVDLGETLRLGGLDHERAGDGKRQLRRFTPAGMREQALVRAKQAQRDAKTALFEARRLAADYRRQLSESGPAG